MGAERSPADHEALGVLEVVQQAPRGRDQEVHTLHQPLGLGAAVGAAHDHAWGWWGGEKGVRLVVVVRVCGRGWAGAGGKEEWVRGG